MFRNSSVFLWHGENIMHEHDYDYTILVTGLAEYIDILYSTLPSSLARLAPRVLAWAMATRSDAPSDRVLAGPR